MYYIGDEEIEALKNLFNKKKLFRYQLNQKSECDLFESEFSIHTGTNHSLILSSGTNALVLALMAAGVQPGDEVLIPTYTFVATAAAVVQVGATPVLVNIDTNLSLCSEDAKKKLTKKTKAIIPVHMDGLAADLESILELARGHGLAVIEDVAQAIGGSYNKRKLGSFGDFGCYSLNESKNISCGEGGVLTTSDAQKYERAFCLHDTPVQFSPSRKDAFKSVPPTMGFSMRASEIQGAIMRVQLSRLEMILQQLRARKNIFKDELASLKEAHVIAGHCADGDCGSSLHLLFEDPAQAAVVTKKLREQNLLFFPVTARPAHASWKWSHLLTENQNTSYAAAHFIDSMSILSRTYKMDISLDLNLEQTQIAAKAIKRTLDEYSL